MERLDESDAEHVGGFEGEFEDVVFGSAFDSSPHDAAALGAVGSRAGDVDECHGGVELR